MLQLIFLLACREEKVNQPPEIEITSHQGNESLLEGFEALFEAEVSDPDHAVSELELRWKLDGEVLCGWSAPSADGVGSCPVLLQGSQVDVVAEVRDPEGLEDSQSLRLQVEPSEIPTAEMLLPTGADRYYSDLPVEFSAVVSDAEDAPESLSLSWSSSEEGALELPTEAAADGTVSGSTLLSSGLQTITLQVEDSTGKVGSTARELMVLDANQPPSCSLLYPEAGQRFEYGEGVFFSGQVSDVEQPPEQLAVSWRSSLLEEPLNETAATENGELQFLAEALPVGTHLLSLSVTDERSALCTEEVTIVVATPPCN